MPRPELRLLPSTVVPAALGQITAIAVIAAIGSTALAASQSAGVRSVAPAAVSSATATAPTHREDAGRPAPATSAVHHPAATAPAKPAATRPQSAGKHASAKPAGRWLPSGTGMWLYEWKKSNGGRAAAVVARAKATGLTHLFVRTGSSKDGFTGQPMLHALLPATAHTDIRVIAWDFPELKRPMRDAWRLADAAWTDRHTNGPHVAAVAPDIETPAEGTSTTARRVSIYLSTLRRLLPSNVSILTTVPWPSSARVGQYPYGAVAAHSDALLPMAYWYDNSPIEVTATSMSFLRRYHRPVQPVGQGYDGKLDVPSLRHNNLRRQMPMFFVTARRMGASAVSIWSWQAAPPIAWDYLSYAAVHRWFPVHR